jgi:uncharacterized protein
VDDQLHEQDLKEGGEAPLPSGGFSEWLREARSAEGREEGAAVPCGDCRGCCTSSYFIHIGPDEKRALARIPKALLFPAPGLPRGHVLLGYDEAGHCPMFKDGACSIYADRPRTCRDYDCRIFPATGVPPGEDKPRIARQAARWRFDFPAADDHADFRALREAARFLRERAAEFPPGFVPTNPPQLARVALRVYPAFRGAGVPTVAAVLEAYGSQA